MTIPIVVAGDLDDGTLETNCDKIDKAVDSVYSDDGVLILMDMGSAVISAEKVIENMPDCKIVNCPLVEGAVVVAIGSSSNWSMEERIQAAQESASEKKL